MRFIDVERARQNLGQNELAERSGIGGGTLSRILSGQTKPSLESLQRLAKGLGYSFYAFLALASGSEEELENRQLIHLFGQMVKHDREILLELARSLLDKQKRDAQQS